MAARVSKSSFYKIARKAARIVRKRCPWRTGNLCSTVSLTRVSDNEYQIRIGGEKAPYAPNTNEPWLSVVWGGKRNPNEGWLNGAVKEIAIMVARECDAKIRRTK